MARLAVFCDYDGTITDVDTFDVLVHAFAGPGVWDALEAELAGGRLSVREVMQQQAAYLRATLDEADALVRERVRFDTSFPEFVRECACRAVPLHVLSSGVAPLIRRALARHGVDVPLVAAELVIDGTWSLRYPDDSANGTDKQARVLRAREGGFHTVYVGDGRADKDAALTADLRFAKRGRWLEQYLRGEGIAFTPFDSFEEIRRSLFA